MSNEINNTLFYRDGRTFTGKVEYTDKNKPCTMYVAKCSRCGGAGGSDKWKHTGWTCFECGGSGKGKLKVDRLYTADQLTKMNAAQAKRDAKKAAAAADRAAQQKAERDAARGAFLEEHKDLFATVASLGDSFLNEMVGQCIERVRISDAQIDLIHKRAVENARKEAAQFVGQVGDRREFTCTVIKFFDWSSKQGYRTFSRYCHIMRDQQGNTIKYIGSTILGAVNWEGSHYDGRWVADTNAAPVTFVATITDHENYNGDKQTVVARPKVKEAK